METEEVATVVEAKEVVAKGEGRISLHSQCSQYRCRKAPLNRTDRGETRVRHLDKHRWR